MVSVITPSYNSEKYIAETITSVLNQTYENWEMLIVDDASSDNTCAIIEDFIKADSRIKLFKQTKNQGAGVARNIAIEKANGNYIAFLDADDLWKPQKLETQIAFMEKHQIAMSFSSYEMIDERSKLLHKKVNALPNLNYQKLLKSNYVGNLTGMYSVQKLGKIYMPNIRKRQDWALWLKTIEKGGDAMGIPESLALYRVHKTGLSGNKLNLIKHNFNFYRKALNFGLFKAVWYFVQFIFEQFFIKSKLITSTQQK